MTQLEKDSLALRCETAERRIEHVERSMSALHLLAYVLAGLTIAAVVVCAVEIRHVYQLVEAQQWRMH